MGKLGKPGKKTREKKKSEDEEIDFPSEEISPAMYRQKKMEEKKENCLLKMVPRCHRVAGKKSNLGMNWSTLQKRKKKAKQHDIPDDVEEDDVNDVREKLRPHKDVKYMDCFSQYGDDSDYYPSSQDSQVS